MLRESDYVALFRCVALKPVEVSFGLTSEVLLGFLIRELWNGRAMY